MNKVTLIGFLGKDPELRFTPGGDAVCNASLATSEKWKDKQGQKQERTEWHRLVIWGKRGEAFGNYCKKGTAIGLEGKIKYGQYVDKEGITRYTMDIEVTDWEFVGSKADNQGSNSGPSGPGQDPALARSGPVAPFTPSGDMEEDNLPF